MEYYRLPTCHLGTNVKLLKIIFVAVLLHLSGSLQAKTLTVVLLANASTQDVIQNFFKEYSRTIRESILISR